MFYFALGEVLRKAYEGDDVQRKKDLRTLSHPRWIGDGPGGVNQRVIARSSRMALQVLRQAYDEAAKGGGGHRNWFRSQATLDLIRNKVADSWDLVAEHADDYRFAGRSK